MLTAKQFPHPRSSYGIKVILAQTKILKILIGKIFNLQINDYLLKYTDYNWTKKLDNYS
jgi:hypothetical protein